MFPIETLEKVMKKLKRLLVINTATTTVISKMVTKTENGKLMEAILVCIEKSPM
jgi:hypothetical protein